MSISPRDIASNPHLNIRFRAAI